MEAPVQVLEPRRRREPEILHLAPFPYERSYCGKPRDRPLKPGATGEFCVVCVEMSQNPGQWR